MSFQMRPRRPQPLDLEHATEGFVTLRAGRETLNQTTSERRAEFSGEDASRVVTATRREIIYGELEGAEPGTAKSLPLTIGILR